MVDYQPTPVFLGPRPEGADVLEDEETPVEEPEVVVRKNPPNSQSRILTILNEYGKRLRELERPSGTQLIQAAQQIYEALNNLDTMVAASIVKQSYTRSEIDLRFAQVDSSLPQWRWGVLPPGNGGTGIANAYNHLFTVGPWRAVWVLSDGTMGTSQSSRTVKTDIRDADEFIDINDLRKVKWCVYRFIEDMNLNLDDSTPRLGMIAEELDDNGLGWLVEYDEDTLKPVGISYPMLGVAALRLAQDAEDRCDALEQRVNELEQALEAR